MNCGHYFEWCMSTKETNKNTICFFYRYFLYSNLHLGYGPSRPSVGTTSSVPTRYVCSASEKRRAFSLPHPHISHTTTTVCSFAFQATSFGRFATTRLLLYICSVLYLSYWATALAPKAGRSESARARGRSGTDLFVGSSGAPGHVMT